MGHKVNPKIFRIKTIHKWSSKWFSKDFYIPQLRQDIAIRKYLEDKLREASLDKITIDRSADSIDVNIYSARPGIIIGKGGSGVDNLKQYILTKIIKDKKINLQLNIKEVSKPNLSARIVAQKIALDLQRRMPYRRVMKKHIENVVKAGAKGVKIICSGRLGGVEIARSETLAQGKIPLHTIRADIDYARLGARTTYGMIGVKVWIYKGEVFGTKEEDKNN